MYSVITKHHTTIIISHQLVSLSSTLCCWLFVKINKSFVINAPTMIYQFERSQGTNVCRFAWERGLTLEKFYKVYDTHEMDGFYVV